MACLDVTLMLNACLAVGNRPLSGASERHPPEIYNRPMAIEFVAQRLQIGDVILTSVPDQEREVEATVVREIDRTETAVRATLRVEEREDFVKEWPLGELVTVVRGP
jgi:hypothetical protein